MSKQQTAVDWLFEQIPAEWSTSKSAFDAYQQAKQMGEEQIKDAWLAGVELGCKNDDPRSAEEYYNKNYVR